MTNASEGLVNNGLDPAPHAAKSEPADIKLGRGVGHLLVSVFAFSIMNAFVKLAVVDYPFGQVVFLRSAVALFPVLLFLRLQGGVAVLLAGRRSTLGWLSALLVGSMLLSFWSYHLLPFADATMYSFVGPLFITALSAPMLGERVGWRCWLAVIIGFAGVVLIARPGSTIFGLGTVVALASALLFAVGMVLTRKSSGSQHPTAIVFYFTLLATLIGLAWLPFGWTAPDAMGWALMIGAGLFGAVGQYTQTQAFRLAPASVCGTVSYARIVMAIGLGYLIWGEYPTAIMLLGSAIIIASGLYLVWHEWQYPRAKHARQSK